MTCRRSLCPMRRPLDDLDVREVPAECPRSDCPLKPAEVKAEKPIEVVDHRQIDVLKVKL